MSSEEQVHCYNPACPDKKFLISKNHDKACSFHSGAPVFHEGLKGWTCCKKRVTCFDEWLDMAGCTMGPHNPVKPENSISVAKSARERAAAEAAEAASRNTLESTVDRDSRRKEAAEKAAPSSPGQSPAQPGTPKVDKYIKAPPTQEQLVVLNEMRPSIDEPKINLQIVTLGSHKREFEKGLATLENRRMDEKASKEKLEKEKDLPKTEKVNEGTICCRKGCKEAYPSMSDCTHHPGVEVFHEGCKYWSCCQRVTSDFNSFLNQEGCHRVDDHLWVDLNKKKTLKLRWDFFQVGDTVTLNFYSKAAVVESVVCKVNSVSIHVEGRIEAGAAKFSFKSELFDTLDLSHSSNKVKIGGSKMEVTLRKKNLIHWADFCPAGERVELISEYISEEDTQEDKTKQSKQEASLIVANKNLKISDITGSKDLYANKKLSTNTNTDVKNDDGNISSDLEDYL